MTSAGDPGRALSVDTGRRRSGDRYGVLDRRAGVPIAACVRSARLDYTTASSPDYHCVIDT